MKKINIKFPPTENILDDYRPVVSGVAAFGKHKSTAIEKNDVIFFYISRLFTVPYDSFNSYNVWSNKEPSEDYKTLRYLYSYLQQTYHYSITQRIKDSSIQQEIGQITILENNLNYTFKIIDLSEEIAFALNQNSFGKYISFKDMFPLIKEKYQNSEKLYKELEKELTPKTNLYGINNEYDENIWLSYESFYNYTMKNFMLRTFSSFFNKISNSTDLNNLNLELKIMRQNSYTNPTNN